MSFVLIGAFELAVSEDTFCMMLGDLNLAPEDVLEACSFVPETRRATLVLEVQEELDDEVVIGTDDGHHAIRGRIFVASAPRAASSGAGSRGGRVEAGRRGRAPSHVDYRADAQKFMREATGQQAAVLLQNAEDAGRGGPRGALSQCFDA